MKHLEILDARFLLLDTSFLQVSRILLVTKFN